MVAVRIDSRIRVRLDDVGPECAQALRDAFTYENPKYVELMRDGYAVGDEQPLLRTWTHEGFDGGRKELTLPRGGMRRLRVAFEAHGLTRQVEDRRFDGSPSLVEEFRALPQVQAPLWDFQQEALREALRRENCIVRAPTGSGKTQLGVAFARATGLPTIVIVWVVGLADQWTKRIALMLGIDEGDVGLVGDGKHRVRPFTVAMQQTVVAMPPRERAELLSMFGTVVADELQRFAAPTVYESIDPVPARYRLGLSADETRKDRKELLIYDLFGDDPIVIPLERVEAAGRVLDVEVRVVPTDFEAPWYKPAMMDKRDFIRRKAFHRLQKELSEDEARNAIIRDIVGAEVEAHEQVLVLIDRREHCLMLDQQFVGMGLRSGKMLGSKPSKAEFDRTIGRIVAGSCDVAVGTVKAVGAGIDLPAVARAVLAAPLGANEQQFGQVRGRVCRASEVTGKVDAILYYLWDRHVYGKKALANICRWNRSVAVREEDGSWSRGKVYLDGLKAAPSLSSFSGGGR